jgi:heme-degrading monooxygenase HmoA
MIARSWDGLTKAEQADAYADYIRRTGVKDLAATAGNLGVYVLRRREGDEARFRVLSLWESMDGIRRFAGEEPERARYYPEDERYLKALDPHVAHFEVVAEGQPDAGGVAARELGRELETLVAGDNWHGPTLHELLDGMAVEVAAARPIAGAHTIWELVLHVTAWTDVFRRRLGGEAVEEPEAGDYPAAPRPTPAAWTEATQALFAAHAALAARVVGLSDAELRSPVPGRPFDARFQVRAAIRHIVYHSGQIGLLRKQGTGHGATFD